MARTIARGKKEYNEDQPLVYTRGVSLSADELKAALPEIHIRAGDEQGYQEFIAYFKEKAESSGFSSQIQLPNNPLSKFSSDKGGEALAQLYLEAHYRCSFPFPEQQDRRTPNASLPGADLVGFLEHRESGWVFAFGEVKTSHESRTPPSVVTGGHGLKNQLIKLRQEELQITLIKYLYFRQKDADWQIVYDSSVENWLCGETLRCALFGVLVRDTEPDKRDMQGSAKELAKEGDKAMPITFIAIYLPADSIQSLGSE